MKQALPLDGEYWCTTFCTLGWHWLADSTALSVVDAQLVWSRHGMLCVTDGWVALHLADGRIAQHSARWQAVSGGRAAH